MGLVFPVHPDLRESKGSRLVLSSTTKKFSVGGSFLFIGLVLAAMYLAAAPLFDIMWKQGTLFDRALTAFFYALIFLYPVVTFLCWGFKETVILSQNEDGSLKIDSTKAIGPIKFQSKSHKIPSIKNLMISNWKGKVNMASIEAQRTEAQRTEAQRTEAQKSQSQESMLKGRYATKGHWILHLDHDPSWVIEKRAKKDDIDWLKAQIDSFFSA